MKDKTTQALEKIVQLKAVTDACQLCHAKDLCMSSHLNSEELQRFKNIVVHRAPMERGEHLYMAGEHIDSIYVLHSGSVKSYLESEDGESQITGFYLPGDVIGIHGLKNAIHNDSVDALETSSVCTLQLSNIEDISTAFPALQKQIMRFVFEELDHDQKMMMVLGKMSADRRMAYFLLDIAYRLKRQGLSGTRFNLSMTRHDIANYLGLAVETVSRILTRMQKSQIIEVERRSINILDHAKLEHIYNCNEEGIPNRNCL